MEHDLLSLDLNVNSLSTGASKRLMDHDSGVGHAETLALGASCQQECTHGCCQAKTICGDISSTHLQPAHSEQRPETVASIAYAGRHKIFTCCETGSQIQLGCWCMLSGMAGILVSTEYNCCDERPESITAHKCTCMASYIPIPAVTDPPGELMKSLMSCRHNLEVSQCAGTGHM